MRRAVAVALLVLAACGGGAGASGPSGSAASPAPSSADARQPSASGRVAASSPKPGTATITAGVTPRAQASGSPVNAAFDKACVSRGETQTMTVAGLKAAEVVGFSSQYSDGSNELTNKEYTSGYGSGAAGADGRFRTTWVVPREAPAGRTDVLVIWGSGKEPLHVQFMIPGDEETC